MEKVAKYIKADYDYIDFEVFQIKNKELDRVGKSTIGIGKNSIDRDGNYIQVIGGLPHQSLLKLDKQNAQKLIAFLKTVK